MALLWAAIRRNSVPLQRFPFLIHVQVFSREISLVCRLKCPSNCISSHFCFQVIVVLLFVLVLVAAISISLLFFLCSLRVVLPMYWPYLQCWRFLFLLLFLTHIVCLYHLWDVRRYASSWVFLFSWFICWSSSLVHIKNGPEYLSKGSALVFLPLMWFLKCSFVSSSFIVLLRYPF